MFFDYIYDSMDMSLKRYMACPSKGTFGELLQILRFDKTQFLWDQTKLIKYNYLHYGNTNIVLSLKNIQHFGNVPQKVHQN